MNLVEWVEKEASPRLAKASAGVSYFTMKQRADGSYLIIASPVAGEMVWMELEQGASDLWNVTSRGSTVGKADALAASLPEDQQIFSTDEIRASLETFVEKWEKYANEQMVYQTRTGADNLRADSEAIRTLTRGRGAGPEGEGGGV